MAVDQTNNVPNTVATLNGFYKSIYSDKLENLIPEGVKLSKMIPFVKPSKKMGLEYKQPVTLRLEHGVTYGGEAGEAFDLEVAIAGATKEATVKGCEMVLRGRVSIGAISRGINDAGSFGSATKHIIKNLMVSSFKKQEQMLFYGKKGLAVSSFDGNNTGTPGTPVASNEILIDVADFASGIFAGGEGMKIDIYDQATSTQLAGGVQITKVDIKAKKLTINYSFAGATGSEAAVIDKVNLSGEFVTIYEHGAKGKECLGLQAMLDGSELSPFGITSSEYSLWDGNRHVVNGGTPAALSFKEISVSIADAVSKGLEGKLDAFVSPVTWADLLNEQTTVIQKDSSYSNKKYENGSESIVFYSQNGAIEIHSSTYVKEGIAFVLDLKSFERVGSQELSMKLPGSSDEFVVKLENSHGIEFRTYCDTALFCNAIGHNILISGILNS